MPHIAFFPWASIDAPLVVGAYRIVPYRTAVENGEIPGDLIPLVADILSTYDGHARAVDRASAPMLHRVGQPITDALDDDAVAAAFAFREQLAFAALSARDLFGVTYWGSENLQLVLQSFAPGGTGAVMTVTRRRDGSVRNIVSKERAKELRPPHVTGRCEIGRAIDVPLLEALQATGSLAPDEQERLADIVHLWVGANTDNRAVSEHSEIVDTVSVFNRLANAHREDEIVPALVKLLPGTIWREHKVREGSRGATVITDAATHDEPTRAIWLRDLIRLRHPYGHGRIAAGERRARWSRFEHMCIACVVVPLAVKALLASHGLYAFTEYDATHDRLIDAVILLEPPTPAARDAHDADHDDDDADDADDVIDGEPGNTTTVPRPRSYEQRWQRARSDAMMWPVIERMAAEMQAIAQKTGDV